MVCYSDEWKIGDFRKLTTCLVCLVAILFVSQTAALAKEDRGALSRTAIKSDLKSPWAIAIIDSATALVTEKEGGLLKIDLVNGKHVSIKGLPEDLVDDIRSTHRFDNGGLFDVAIDPAFAANGYIYLSYAAAASNGRTTKVVRGRLAGNQLKDLKELLTATPYTEDEFFHYGGGIVVGADDKLYITVGERIFSEDSNPPLPIAQDVGDRRGKIFRINRDGTIPPDNPDFGEDAIPGLFAIGIRASQGLALNKDTSQIWFSEHGSSRGDEINVLKAGANYGWPFVTTGDYRSKNFNPPEPAELTFQEPVWAWKHTVAPTGLTFYSGSKFPEWSGDLLVTGLSVGSFWRFDLHDGVIASVEELFVGERFRARDVAVAPDGNVYIVIDTLIENDEAGAMNYTGVPSGKLLRIDRSTIAGP